MRERVRRRTTIVGGIAGLVAVVVLLWPDLLGLHAVTGFMHLAAIRSLVTVCVLVVVALLLPVLLSHAARPVVGGFLVVLGLGGLVSAGVVVSRGLAAEAEIPAQADADRTSLTVATANVLYTNDDYGDLLAELAAAGADAIAVQETQRAVLEPLARDAGLLEDFTLLTEEQDEGAVWSETALLVRSALRPEQIAGEHVPYTAVGAATTAGDVYAVHAHSPISRRLVQSAWRDSVDAAGGLCAAGGDTLVVGDFNATVDHRVLRASTDCSDAAQELGILGHGTWPAGIPARLGPHIDHQLYDPQRFTPSAGRVLDIPGSDHRAVLVDYTVRP